MDKLTDLKRSQAQSIAQIKYSDYLVHHMQNPVSEPIKVFDPIGISLKYLDFVVDPFCITVGVGTSEGVENVFLSIGDGIGTGVEFFQIAGFDKHIPGLQVFFSFIEILAVNKFIELLFQKIGVLKFCGCLKHDIHRIQLIPAQMLMRFKSRKRLLLK